MPVFVNRTLNLKKIKLIGFDMDYTLVAYHAERFEELTYQMARESLVKTLGYPEKILSLSFDFERAIVGLVIDRRNGFLLQLSRFNKVKTSYYGLEEVPYREQEKIYGTGTVDLRDPDFISLDTLFAIALGVLFSQLVQLKKEGLSLPDYADMERDIREAIDLIHRDGSLKGILKTRFPEFVVQDPKVAGVLERYKDYGKKLMIITNSDYDYTQPLLDYAINPFLTKHAAWEEVFDIVITLADKPLFFETKSRFLKIDPDTGLMSNYAGSVRSGLYQGGCFSVLERDLELNGSEILYFGDHIYGDVVSIKKRCNWRTALVLGNLEKEMEGLRNSRSIQEEIDLLMGKKEELERELNKNDILKYEGKLSSPKTVDSLYQELDKLNSRISALIDAYVKFFNPYWGQILRAGSEESFYAGQVENYACIYMTRISDLFDYSPRTYFRPIKRIMPHELKVLEE